MRKNVITILVLLVCVVMFVKASTINLTVTKMALADPGDVIITFTIPAAKVADFRAGFLAECPNSDTAIDDSDPNNLIETPKYTDKEWFKLQLLEYAKKIYRRGKNKLATESAIIDNNVMQ